MLFSVLSIRLRVEIGRRLLHSDVCGTVSNVIVIKEIPSYGNYYSINTFAASYLNTQGLNPLKPNDAYICRTAPLTSRRCILYIYSTHICTAYFKRAANSPFFPLQNAVYFIILHCLVPVQFTFYIQGVLKFKCKIQAPKG